MSVEAGVFDRREGGRWTRAQWLKNEILYRLATAALAATESVSGDTLAWWGERLGHVCGWLMPRTRARAEANLKIAFPFLERAAIEDLAEATFSTLGRELGLAVAALGGRHEPALPLDRGAKEILEEALREGRGVLFLSAHLAPWERVAETLSRAGFPFTCVARESYDARFTALLDRLRARLGVSTIHRGGPGAAASMLRVLKRGEILGIPMDLKTRVPSLAVPFLDVLAPTPTGPARLALRSRAAVVVGSVAETGAGQRGARSLVVTARRLRAPTDRDFTTAELLTAINAELSARIRALPTRWPFMHDRF